MPVASLHSKPGNIYNLFLQYCVSTKKVSHFSRQGVWWLVQSLREDKTVGVYVTLLVQRCLHLLQHCLLLWQRRQSQKIEHKSCGFWFRRSRSHMFHLQRSVHRKNMSLTLVPVTSPYVWTNHFDKISNRGTKIWSLQLVPRRELLIFAKHPVLGPKSGPCELSHEFKQVWIEEKSSGDIYPRIVPIPSCALFVGLVHVTVPPTPQHPPPPVCTLKELVPGSSHAMSPCNQSSRVNTARQGQSSRLVPSCVPADFNELLSTDLLQCID